MKNILSKKLLIILGSILLVLVVGGFVVVNYLDNYLKEQITNSINENKKSPYRIEIDDVQVRLFPTKVTLEKIKVRTDSISAEESGQPNAKIDVEKVVFKGASLWKYISNGEWHADRLTLQNPIIDIKYLADSTQGVSRAADTVANFVVAPLSVGILEIQNLTGHYQYNFNSIIELKKLDLEIDDARWLKPPTFRFSSDKVQISFEQLNHKTADFVQMVDTLNGTLNAVSFDTSYVDVLRFLDAKLLISAYSMAHKNGTNFKIAEIDYKDNLVKIKNVELSQDLDEKREIKAQQLEAHNLDWQALQRQLIKADKILVFNPDISILKDRNRHGKPTTKKMPYQWKIGLAIDTLQIEKGNIVYSERAEGLDGIGSLAFDSLNMMALNFHNFEESKPTKIKADMYFMKESRIEIEMDMPLNTDTFEGSIKGFCTQIEIPSLNKMLSPITRFEANKGVIKRAEFDAKINDGNATGVFYITYTDLEVTLLKKNSDKRRKFLSGLLNVVIDKNVEGKEGKINYQREHNDSLLRYVWRTIRSGLIASMLP
ncbi:hypothetical protein Fleli_2059 [Bernardetia litoralis DSM 6794]|uniref:AsmA-like C-terminal domain-containing protein n=1 Tax=Bernardetia litoralis (strain ATCC 23117 / DSM 6794 / NBRC 15988 / NCIMB 1366 / Fx l1 / Sio-4) TaxID=880071 RepID=I4AKF7_BERLS|nr:hypothetical protein [Bernardetia litoralis]AFM04442.1 hypothetical protein Fleli_2059 [Bernardetia litoralis DSM 6794]